MEKGKYFKEDEGIRWATDEEVNEHFSEGGEIYLISDDELKEYVTQDVLDNMAEICEADEMIDAINNHPDSLEDLLTHFEEMYENFGDSINIARFALQNIIEIRSHKIFKDHCEQEG